MPTGAALRLPVDEDVVALLRWSEWDAADEVSSGEHWSTATMTTRARPK
jgi:hypothetical protein